MDVQAQPQPIRILVVEDNPGDVRLTQMALKASKLYVMADVVATGPEALAYLRREDPYSGASPPDLILIDLVLPGLSGYEIIPRLHELSPEAGIIMVTMFDSDGYRKAALAAGADDFVSKQSVAGDLMPAIHRVAHGRKAQQPEGRKVHITH